MLFVTIHVNDLLIYSNNKDLKTDAQAIFDEEIKYKEIHRSWPVFGNYNRTRSYTSLDEEIYIDKIIHHFQMVNAAPVATPTDPNVRFGKHMAPKRLMKSKICERFHISKKLVVYPLLRNKDLILHLR